MRAVVQRVSEVRWRSATRWSAASAGGCWSCSGCPRRTAEKEADYLADKIVHLRIFEDDDGKLNRSLLEVGGEMLVVSQFTLLGDCRKGRRPSFIEAADPEQAAAPLRAFRPPDGRRWASPVQTGRFQALMAVSLVNDGPVTLILDSYRRRLWRALIRMIRAQPEMICA
ncbi:MAG: D-aminoacyl-tRNA deacylase [Desulfobacterales bacterium]|nr:D-aminoacyl-tRNA deacylase [Desulfobacterales bacterium]